MVFGLAGGAATTVAVAATAPGVVKAFNEGKGEDEDEDGNEAKNEDENATDTDGKKEQ